MSAEDAVAVRPARRPDPAVHAGDGAAARRGADRAVDHDGAAARDPAGLLGQGGQYAPYQNIDAATRQRLMAMLGPNAGPQ